MGDREVVRENHCSGTLLLVLFTSYF